MATAAKVLGSGNVALPTIKKLPALEFADQHIKDYQNELQKLHKILKEALVRKENLEVELKDRNDKIAILKQKELVDSKQARSAEELEELLVMETQKRISLENEIKQKNLKIDKLNGDVEKLQSNLASRVELKSQQERTIIEQKGKIEELELLVKNFEFDVDELKVLVVRHQQRTDELEVSMKLISQKNEFLSQMEATFREENCSLQKRLRELIDANKEVTNNYQAIKKNHDMKRSEFEEIATELEEAKNACQLAIRQKKAVQNELASAVKQRQEMSDKNKAMENLLARKEKDISDLLTKVNDTINDYELKLERKEEQMWAMSLQMSEESQKNRNHINIDPDFINDIEKKWQAKEKNLQAEIERIAGLMKTKDESIASLSATIADLQKKQFQPRMERLKAIEKDIKSRMEEYALAEERMETGFLCPRDLQCFKTPMTLIPCGVRNQSVP
ncbi:hypothetical protein HDU97_004817 [Phlyctochytrium planicorne]|nr:hypothetical protein HDU97_004817 [Phlyctochytrium planicorne]